MAVELEGLLVEVADVPNIEEDTCAVDLAVKENPPKFGVFWLEVGLFVSPTVESAFEAVNSEDVVLVVGVDAENKELVCGLGAPNVLAGAGVDAGLPNTLLLLSPVDLLPKMLDDTALSVLLDSEPFALLPFVRFAKKSKDPG